MFGYVIPDKPNMLVKDLSEYRAYYCGLCKAIGKSYSEKARFLTGYDCTFLAAFLHNLYIETPKFNDEVCILNPVKKKPSAFRTKFSRRLPPFPYFWATTKPLTTSGMRAE